MAKGKLTPRAQEMHALIRRYLSSDLTQKKFCEQEKLPRSTFQYWLHHLRKYNNPGSQTAAHEFIPLKLKGHCTSGNGCRISYPSGVTIYFDGTVDTQVLLTLIKSESC